MTVEEINLKIMTKKRFIKAVEELVSKHNMTYMEAMTHIVEERGMDYSAVKRLLDDGLKEKLRVEATELRLVKDKRLNKLPGIE